MERFVNDPEGKLFLKQYLENKGYKVDIPTNPYSCFDLVASKNGKAFVFELKMRNCDSRKYGDSIVELDKIKNLKLLDFEKGTKSYIVNFFSDCFHVHPIDTFCDIQVHKARKTTQFENQEWTTKFYCSYRNGDKSRVDY